MGYGMGGRGYVGMVKPLSEPGKAKRLGSQRGGG